MRLIFCICALAHASSSAQYRDPLVDLLASPNAYENGVAVGPPVTEQYLVGQPFMTHSVGATPVMNNPVMRESYAVPVSSYPVPYASNQIAYAAPAVSYAAPHPVAAYADPVAHYATPIFHVMMDEVEEKPASAQSRRSNSNSQSGIQQFGFGNINLQGNIQQIGRRSSQMQSHKFGQIQGKQTQLFGSGQSQNGPAKEFLATLDSRMFPNSPGGRKQQHDLRDEIQSFSDAPTLSNDSPQLNKVSTRQEEVRLYKRLFPPFPLPSGAQTG